MKLRDRHWNWLPQEARQKLGRLYVTSIESQLLSKGNNPTDARIDAVLQSIKAGFDQIDDKFLKVVLGSALLHSNKDFGLSKLPADVIVLDEIDENDKFSGTLESMHELRDEWTSRFREHISNWKRSHDVVVFLDPVSFRVKRKVCGSGVNYTIEQRPGQRPGLTIPKGEYKYKIEFELFKEVNFLYKVIDFRNSTYLHGEWRISDGSGCKYVYPGAGIIEAALENREPDFLEADLYESNKGDYGTISLSNLIEDVLQYILNDEDKQNSSDMLNDFRGFTPENEEILYMAADIRFREKISSVFGPFWTAFNDGQAIDIDSDLTKSVVLIEGRTGRYGTGFFVG